MLYVTHAHEATAFSQTLVLPAFLPAGPCLAVVKHSSIAFLSLAPTAASSSNLLEEIQTVEVHGRILSVQAVSSSTDGKQSQTLLVLTDHHRPRIIALKASAINGSNLETRILTTAVLPLTEVARAPAETALGIWIEPFSDIDVEDGSGQRVAVCHAYKGTMRVTPLALPTPPLSPKQSRAADQDAVMHDAASLLSAPRSIDFAQSFSVRLPHPGLLSCALLHPKGANSAPVIALLSQSSLASAIPGLGAQCLPVLSYHSIDVATQELSPMPWGPPRKPPREEALASSAKASSNAGPSSSGKPDKEQARKQHGPSAMGLNLDSAALQRREEAWAASELAQAHVPLPTADAIGAHLVHAIPASLDGGVILFCENSILYIPPPPERSTAPNQPTSPVTSKGKRRKASTSSSIDSRRLSTAEKSAGDVQPLPASSTTTAHENKKRRRSSAATVASVTSPTSPSASKSSLAPKPRLKLLRAILPYPVQVVAAVSVVDSQNQPTLTRNASNRSVFTILFGTSSGHLHALRVALSIDNDGDANGSSMRPSSMRIEMLGEISQPAGPHSLTYLGDDLVQVSSVTGDSALYKIEPSKIAQDSRDILDEQMMTPPSSPTQTRSSRGQMFAPQNAASTDLPIGGSLSQLRKWDNLGPIVDFVVDDGAGGDPTLTSGTQARIVTCSGSGPSGSIRVVRNGVSVQDLTSIQIPDATRVWAVNQAFPALITTSVLVSFPTATSFLVFGADGQLTEASAALQTIGIDSKSPTFAAASVHYANSSCLVLVQAHGASLARQDGASLIALDQWRPQTGVEVTAASANSEGQLIVALSDRTLVYLIVDQGKICLQTSITLQEEVSCLDISSLEPGERAAYLACGFWTTRSMQIFALPELAPVAQQSVAKTSLSSVPRSILLHQFGSSASSSAQGSVPPQVLIGLGDGNLVTYDLSLPTADSYSRTVGMFDCKTVSLGSRALCLDAIETCEGLRAVAVAGSRSCIVFADSKRFSYNTIKYKDLRCAATLHAGPGQKMHLFALGDSLQLSSVGALQRRDVRTIPLGLEQPLAITAWQSQRAFAVSTWTFLPRGTATEQSQPRGSIQILDQTDFHLLDQVRLEPNERPNCVKVVTLEGKYVDGKREVLIVGTGYMLPDSSETMSGRLLGFELPTTDRSKGTSGRSLRMLFSREVAGNVYSVVGLKGKLVAAVNSEVMVFGGMERSLADAEHSNKAQDKTLFKLKQKGSWASSFIACNLSVIQPDRVIVGDALRSMNILRIVGAEGHVVEIARDCDPFWTTATEMVDEATQTFIGADISFNMYTTQRVQLSEALKKRIQQAKDADMESGRRERPTSNVSTSASDDGYAHVMQRRAVWHYGDMINKFLRTSLVSDTGIAHIGVHKLLFCTASGAIGVIADVDPKVGNILTAVERNTIQLIEAVDSQEQALPSSQSPASLPRSTGVVGGIAHQDWRTLRTDHRTQAPAGFLDGNILNMLVNGRLDRQQIGQILAGPDSDLHAVPADRETVQRYIDALAQVS